MTGDLITDQAELDCRVRAYPLTPDSLVWIAGGWYGAQTKWFSDFYRCYVRAFEPQTKPYQALEKLMQDGSQSKIKVYNYGLGDKDGFFQMCKPDTDACSFIIHDSVTTVPGPYVLGEMRDIAHEFENDIENVDLFLMNMEGYELILLPHLMQTGLISRFDILMVQFHLGWEGGAAYPQLREDMLMTHNLLWEYRTPAWVVWKRK